MLESYLRPTYQRYLVYPVIYSGLISRISPNIVTFMGCITGCMACLMLILNQHLAAMMLLLFSGYCDTVDGTLARHLNKTSDIGTVYDIVADRIVEFSVIIGLYSVDSAHRGYLALTMLGSILICVTSFLVVGIFTPNTSNKSFYYSVGLIERAESFIFFIAMIFLPDYFNLLSVSFILLVFYTSFHRINQFHRMKQAKYAHHNGRSS